MAGSGNYCESVIAISSDEEEDVGVVEDKDKRKITKMSEESLAVPATPKVRVRRGLAQRLGDETTAESEISTEGVYTSQLSSYQKQLQSVWDFGTLDNFKNGFDTPESNDVCELSDAAVHQPQIHEVLRSPSPPAVLIIQEKKQQKRSTKNQKLLQQLEEAQLLYLSQKAMEKLKKPNKLDISSDSEEVNSDDCICEEEEQEMEKERCITVKVAWMNELKKFTMLKKENFSKLISELAKMNNICESQILLTLNDQAIRSYDTPLSIGLKITDILEFGILSKAQTTELPKQISANVICLKLQSKTSKKKLDITINKNDPMMKVAQEFAKHAGMDVSSIVLKFDGDDIELDSTPEELELEDGYCIDVYQT